MKRYRKSGVIKGGNCDGRHKARLARRRGVDLAWQWLQDKGCVTFYQGKHRIKEVPNTPSIKKLFAMCGRNGNVEIGFRRLLQDLAAPLCVERLRFTPQQMGKWLERCARLEWKFMIARDGYGNKKALYYLPIEPHDEGLFKQRVANGELVGSTAK